MDLIIFLCLMLVPSTISTDSAFVQVVLYDPDPSSGRYITRKSEMSGIYSLAGSFNSAEGEIKQLHPLSLCDISDDGLYEYGWVGLVELEPSYLEPVSCSSVYDKAKRALDKGATAVIFDITKRPDAVFQLNSEVHATLDRPIILIEGSAAYQLAKIMRNKQVARVRIQTRNPPQPESQYNQYINMAIFMGCFVVVFFVCIFLLAKLKCWRRSRETPTNNVATETLRRMRTKRFRKNHNADGISINSNQPLCAICLEYFNQNEELRVIPCAHEFHKHCVDPWLKEKLTCPLCNFNILGEPPNLQRRSRQISSPSMTSHSSIHVTRPYIGYTEGHEFNSPSCCHSSATSHYDVNKLPCGAGQLYYEGRRPGGNDSNSGYDLPPSYDSLDTARNLPAYCGVRYAHGNVAHGGMHAHGTHDKQKCGNVTRCAEIRDGASCGNASYRNVTHGIWTERNPSLRSGYSPDSSGLSDVDKYEVSPYLFGPHPVYHVTDTACYVTDTSVRSVFGSSLISDPPAPLSRDKFILKSCKRSSTPCIGYSSSDAEQVARVSVSSLDGVLESVMVPTMFSDDSNSDHIWSDDVIYSTSTHQNEARHVTNSSNHVREGRTRCDL